MTLRLPAPLAACCAFALGFAQAQQTCLKDKVVLINFVFTQGGDTCPLITARLVQVKKALGEAFGRDVRCSFYRGV